MGSVESECGRFDDYSLKWVYTLVNMCEKRVPLDSVRHRPRFLAFYALTDCICPAHRSLPRSHRLARRYNELILFVYSEANAFTYVSCSRFIPTVSPTKTLAIHISLLFISALSRLQRPRAAGIQPYQPRR